MSIKKALQILYKFAEIPVYQKCKKCGDADPFMGDEGLCWKCFEPDKVENKNKKDIKQNAENPVSIISNLKRYKDNRAHYQSVKLNDKYIISIQASQEHYSTPRETLDSPNDYKNFEVAFRNEKNGPLKNPLSMPEFKDKSWAQYFKYDFTVGAFMPRKEVEKMIIDLQNG